MSLKLKTLKNCTLNHQLRKLNKKYLNNSILFSINYDLHLIYYCQKL